MWLLQSGRLDEIRLESDQSSALVRLLDAVIIKLEGGTDGDLAILDTLDTDQSRNDK